MEINVIYSLCIYLTASLSASSAQQIPDPINVEEDPRVLLYPVMCATVHDLDLKRIVVIVVAKHMVYRDCTSCCKYFLCILS